MRCWCCNKERSLRPFTVPLEVGSNPAVDQEIFICQECAENLARELVDWREDTRLLDE